MKEKLHEPLLTLKMEEEVRSQGMQAASRSWKRQGNRIYLKTSRRSIILPTWTLHSETHFGFLTSWQQGNKFVLLQVIKLVVIYYCSMGNSNTPVLIHTIHTNTFTKSFTPISGTWVGLSQRWRLQTGTPTYRLSEHCGFLIAEGPQKGWAVTKSECSGWCYIVSYDAVLEVTQHYSVLFWWLK